MRLLALIALAVLAGCGGGPTASSPAVAPRSYRMGFSSAPPRPDQALVLRGLALWEQRADAALIFMEPPWTALLQGADPESLVRADPLPLVDHYRAKGLRVIANLDPTNGIDRTAEAAPLVAAGRSLREPAVRDLYRRYVGAFVSVIRPEVLGLASETNLVRPLVAPDVYTGFVAAANEAAAEARRRDSALRLMFSVQVDVAHGVGWAPAGIEQDRADFPFAQALGLSSYPYLTGVADPDDLPLDYYASLAGGLPVLLLEGGWPSVNLGPTIVSSPAAQRRYVERQVKLLDAAQAEAWFQITFTDLDLTGAPAGLAPFASLGLVDVNLQPKPALQAWDAAFARPLRR